MVMFREVDVRTLILPLGILVVLLGVAVAVWVYAPGPMEVQKLGAPSRQALDIGGDFVLTDQHGKRHEAKEFRGRMMLVYFGYSFCPDICPNDLLVMTQVLERLGDERGKLAAMFVTVDPERDTVEHLAKVMENFHPEILALTGSQAEIDQAKRAFKVYSAKATPEGTVAEYLVDHSTFMYLLDNNGKYITHFTHGTPVDEVFAQIRQAMAEDAAPVAGQQN